MKKKISKCIEWTGSKTMCGYGVVWLGRGIRKRIHRVVYEGIYGKITNGLVIDHLCRNKLCINPNHLEAVTNKTNVLRGVGLTAVHAKKIKCPRGHKYDRVNSDGSRGCSICNKERIKKWRLSKAIRSLIK